MEITFYKKGLGYTATLNRADGTTIKFAGFSREEVIVKALQYAFDNRTIGSYTGYEKAYCLAFPNFCFAYSA